MILIEHKINRICTNQHLSSYFIISSLFSTIVNRLCSELNRLITELALERDILIDFQSKLDAAEYVNIQNIVFLFQLFSMKFSLEWIVRKQ
jgi:hypothetical protein